MVVTKTKQGNRYRNIRNLLTQAVMWVRRGLKHAFDGHADMRTVFGGYLITPLFS